MQLEQVTIDSRKHLILVFSRLRYLMPNVQQFTNTVWQTLQSVLLKSSALKETKYEQTTWQVYVQRISFILVFSFQNNQHSFSNNQQSSQIHVASGSPTLLDSRPPGVSWASESRTLHLLPLRSSIDHLLVGCTVTSQIWSRFLLVVGLQRCLPAGQPTLEEYCLSARMLIQILIASQVSLLC